jgi:uncharacterized membrane protein YbhN (UPF0104 family)
MNLNKLGSQINRLFLQKNTRVSFTALALILSISILGYLVYSQWDTIKNYQWNINWILLIPIMLLYTINLFLVSHVWTLILNKLGIKGNTLAHFRNYCISNLMKRLPGTIWYVAWRAQFYKSEHGVSPKIISLASGIELAVFSIATAITAILFSLQMIILNSARFWGLIGIIIVCLIFFIPAVQKRLFSWAGEVNSTIDSKSIIKWTIEYIVTRIIGGSMLFFVAKLFYPFEGFELITIIGIHSLVAALSLVVFFLPTNLGFTEVGISLLLSTFIPSSIAVLIVIANRLLVLFLDLLWGALSLWIKGESRAINPKELL